MNDLGRFAGFRRLTHEVRIGEARIGARNPVLVQSMTTTLTKDVEATVRQTVQLARAGSLDKAYAELRRLGRLSTPLRLLVWRGRGQGAEFSVVAETPFLSESPALALIGSLPVGLKDEARMLQFARKDGRFLGRLDATTLRLVKNGG